MKRGLFLVLVFSMVFSFALSLASISVRGSGPIFYIGNASIDADGDSYPASIDCDDSSFSVNPSSSEFCNGVDDDCDGFIDESLSRKCGLSEVGACSFGTERCIGGSWVECTAVLPSEESCNGIDDDCDGIVDDGCAAAPLSDESLALKQFLDLKFGKGRYDFSHFLKKHNETVRKVVVKKHSKIVDGRTKMFLTLVPLKAAYNLTVFEYIPKSFAKSSKDILFSTSPEVIQDDPLVAWNFAELNEPVKISYEIKGEIVDADKKTVTMLVAEGFGALPRPWYFDYVPLLIIPILGMIFIVLADTARGK